MNRILPAALALLCAPAFAEPVAAAERRYSITDFDKVLIEGPYQVTLATGRSPGAVATGTQQAIDGVSIDVQGRTLRVRVNKSSWGGYPGTSAGPVRIALVGHDLRTASVTGSGTLAIDKAKGLRLDLSVSGSGSMSIAAIEADTLNISLRGSGSIGLAGRAKLLRATISGTGGFDGAAFKADDAQVTADTAGLVKLGVLRSAKVKAVGSGDVEILGSPACTVETLGGGAVICDG